MEYSMEFLLLLRDFVGFQNENMLLARKWKREKFMTSVLNHDKYWILF